MSIFDFSTPSYKNLTFIFIIRVGVKVTDLLPLLGILW